MRAPLGAVLVGGRSRRLGVDKALLPWDGEPLALRVANRLARVCPQVVLVGGGGRGYERLGRPWWPDPPGLAGTGPMAGLMTALSGAEAVLLAGCDLPHLEPIFLGRLVAAAGPAPLAVPVRRDGRVEPLVGLYRQEILPFLRRALASGERRMTALLALPGARLVPVAALGPEEDVERALANVNTPADLRASRNML